MHRIRSVVILASLVVAARADAMTIDACGTWFVPRNEVVDLAADLDCPPSSTIDLGRGARLRLNGHRLRATAGGTAVSCQDVRCSIEGPGAIVGWDQGVALRGGARRLVLRDVLLEGNGAGVAGDFHPAMRVDATDVVVRDGTFGIIAHTVVGQRLELTGNVGPAIDAASLRGADITVSGTGTGDLRGAVHVVRANADALVIRDNAGVGLVAEGNVTLRGSTIVGNDAAGMGTDIATRRVPRLRDSSCGRSRSLDTGLPLGVCVGD